MKDRRFGGRDKIHLGLEMITGQRLCVVVDFRFFQGLTISWFAVGSQPERSWTSLKDLQIATKSNNQPKAPQSV